MHVIGISLIRSPRTTPVCNLDYVDNKVLVPAILPTSAHLILLPSFPSSFLSPSPSLLAIESERDQSLSFPIHSFILGIITTLIMRLLTTSVVVGATAVAAATPQQYVLEQPLHDTTAKVVDAFGQFTHPFNQVKESWNSLSSEVKATWEEVTKLFPDQMNGPSFAPPKKSHRKPNSHWDYVMKGADVQSVMVENVHGEKERKIDGELKDFTLRAKKVDPSSLGVDPNVTQFSGYLDDDENDKHLFYCTWIYSPPVSID